ncbi:MAG: VacB/RNase II family 3'-5' exoribonuclease [Myxococcales bacterium]|nr:VacB/RNase II family 3'-5' exoribonuclease [Myxococcales bacterium]
MNNKQRTGDTDVVACRLQVNPGGFAFAVREDGEGSIFIPPGRFAGALDGDSVAVRYWPAERGDEGTVEAILKRGRSRITGMLREAGRYWILEPDDPRILAVAEVDGHGEASLPTDVVVVAKILSYPERGGDNMVVEVERVLGPPGDLATEQAKVLIEHGIDPFFPEDVLAEAETVPREVRPEDLEGRDDLRALPFMTIDPDDARDFDDAVAVELVGKDLELDDMRLHVAVADVSHYVREGTAIDREAAWRCFSAYLPNQAIPMLPEALSSHMCSLVPEQDRCAMVVSMTVDASGRFGDIEVRAAVIHSRARLTYGMVAKELDQGDRLAPAVGERVRLLRRAADRLRKRRLHDGAIELNLPETKVVLDEDDPTRIRDIVPSRASRAMARAYNLIEELMLAANEAVASLAIAKKLPIVFRIHAAPDEERLAKLATAAEVLGVRVDPERLTSSRGFQKLVGKVKSHAKAQALNMLMLRAMSQAEYSIDNIGHFALASGGYVHFTSPIRRYPDVIAHRVLKAYLARAGGKAGPKPAPAMPDPETSGEQAQRSSLREREVLQAERDSKSLYAASFMRERIGDRFEGSISGMARSGVFVSIEHPFVDGMIRMDALERSRGEGFELEDNGIRLVGRRGKFSLCVGDRVVVEVVDADIARRRVEFALISKLS